METIVKGAVAVEDSEEETLHCSVRGYCIWSTALDN